MLRWGRGARGVRLLLGDLLLAPEASAAGRVWCARERIEREAAAHFDWIADRLDAYPELATMARSAAADERDHAVRCRVLVERFAPGLAPLDVPAVGALGPTSLSAERRLLYATVAVACVTESLSCGLLLAMRERATDADVAATIQHILRDEVQHSRLGWAHLALEAERADVSWLAPHVQPMIAAALTHEVTPMCAEGGAPSLGVLAPADSHAVVAQVVEAVIRPGLAEFGVHLDESLLPT